jgi:hypothetical protein
MLWGNTLLKPNSTLAKMPSMAPTNQLSTHKVMANGSHTSNPANMYFLMFMVIKNKN